jgi:glycosyltransferase involved in cell wall biosynthesis
MPLKVSLVTPSYQYGHYLKTAIDSVLAQDYPHLEYIVVDGGSKDNTVDVLKSYGDRVSWISEPDKGQSDAINKGLALTTGEIVGWLNADDRLEAGAIRRIVEAFEQYPEVGLVYGDVSIIDAQDKQVAIYPFVQPCDFAMLRDIGDFIVQPGAYWRRDLVTRDPPIRVDLNWTMDYELWLYLAQRTKFLYIPHLLAAQREHADAKTSQGGEPRFDEIQAMVGEYGGTLPSGFVEERATVRFALGLREESYRKQILQASHAEIKRLGSRHLNHHPDDLELVLDLLHETKMLDLAAPFIQQAAVSRLTRDAGDTTLILNYQLNQRRIQRYAWFEQGKRTLIHERKVGKAFIHILKARMWQSSHWWIFFIGTMTGGTLLRRYIVRGRTALGKNPIVNWLIKRL